jgi:hypothetical protein
MQPERRRHGVWAVAGISAGLIEVVRGFVASSGRYLCGRSSRPRSLPSQCSPLHCSPTILPTTAIPDTHGVVQ